MTSLDVGVLLLSNRERFREQFHEVFSALTCEVLSSDVEISQETVTNEHPTLLELFGRARAYLSNARAKVKLRFGVAADYGEAEVWLRQARTSGESFRLGTVFVDESTVARAELPQQASQSGSAMWQLLESCGAKFCINDGTNIVVFTDQPAHGSSSARQVTRVAEVGHWALSAEMLTHVMLLFSRLLTMPLGVPQSGVAPSLAGAIADQFSDWFGQSWQLFHYTGSVVSCLIAALEREARQRGVLSLRGANEHSLACGAFAGWQLWRRPSVIVVTSGMIDEFRGTLANLREARARVLIVCAENRLGQWFAFQGTLNREENTQSALAAKRIHCVYVEDSSSLAEKWKEVVRLLVRDEGPVVLLATVEVLECVVPFPRPKSVVGMAQSMPPLASAVSRPAAELATSADENLRVAINCINRERVRILWQCGSLSQTDAELAYSIAERCGIALVDSLRHPGAVARYAGGKRRPNYLGTLGLYGYSPGVYAYLHQAGRLAHADQQRIFFLASKVPQADTPFSEGMLRRALNLFQVTQNPNHCAPFVDYPIIAPVASFLNAIERHLDVDDEVLAWRRAELARCQDVVREPTTVIPTRPMRIGYFFSQLSTLLESLIVEEGFRYVGSYDVGRGGISAIRNLPRTDPGFSGWYGRALMGDALQATAHLALMADTNIIAFIGDGARGMVPDPLPWLLENIRANNVDLNRSVTVFHLVNGSLSLINTYQQHRHWRNGDRQVQLPQAPMYESDASVDGVTLRRRILTDFPCALIRQALILPREVTWFDVILDHDGEPDGLSLLEGNQWQLQ